MTRSEAVDSAVNLGGIELRNPVLTASGTFGYGTEFAPFLDLRRLGGFVAKSLTLEPRVGNPPPRIAEAPSGLHDISGSVRDECSPTGMGGTTFQSHRCESPRKPINDARG